MAILRLEALGPFRAVLDGRELGLGGRQQRLVAALLFAADGRAVPVQQLLERVWTTELPRTAKKTLQGYVHHLRAALGAALASSPGGYQLAVEASDIADVEQHRRAGAVVAADAPHTAAEHYRQALAIWRGPPYSDLADSDGLRGEITRLEELRRATLADLFDLELAAGHHDLVIAEVEAAIAEFGLHDRLRAQQATALFLSGRQADALRVLADHRNWLGEESGLPLSQELQNLERQILEESLDRPAPASAGSSYPARPVAGTSRQRGPTARRAAGGTFVGRNDLVTDVVAGLRDERIVTLTGPGGVGKTRLAREVAQAVDDQFRAGVWWADLATITDPADVTTTVAAAIGVAAGASMHDDLLLAIERREVLLVVDNCEHVIDAAADLIDWVAAHASKVVVLATSREPLGLANELVIAIEPLDVSHTDSPAVELFVERARLAGSPDAADRDAIRELCEQLDGLPLAIELASARSRSLPPRAMLASLDDRLSLLAGRRGGDPRHRTLRDTIAWSYALLSDEERAVFRATSIFAASFDLDAAEGIVAEVFDCSEPVAILIAGLVDKSMLTGASTGYRQLESMRQFGAEALNELGEHDAIERAHAAYHRQLVTDAAAGLRGPEQAQWWRRLERSWPDVRQAVNLAVDRGDIDTAFSVIDDLWMAMRFHDVNEITNWAGRAVDLPGAAEHPQFGRVVDIAGFTHLLSGDLERRREFVDRAVRANPPFLEGYIGLLTSDGRTDEALEFAWSQHDEAVARGDDLMASHSLFNVMRVLTRAGRSDEAARAGETSVALADAAAYPALRAWARIELARVLDDRPDRAAALAAEAVEISRSSDAKKTEAYAQSVLGWSLACAGSPADGLEPLITAIRINRDMCAGTELVTAAHYAIATLRQLGGGDDVAVLAGAFGSLGHLGRSQRLVDTIIRELDAEPGSDRARGLLAEGRALNRSDALDRLEEALLDASPDRAV